MTILASKRLPVRRVIVTVLSPVAKPMSSALDGQPIVGSGPFELVEGTAGGATARFEARDDYWKADPYLDEVVFRVFKSKDSAVQALIKGEVDYVEDVPPLGAGRSRITVPLEELPPTTAGGFKVMPSRATGGGGGGRRRRRCRCAPAGASAASWPAR